MSSAFVGDPPNTQEDVDIVKGLLYAAGRPTDDYQHGILLPPAHNGHTSTDSRVPAVIAANAIGIAIIFSVTTLRLLYRRYSHKSAWGWDDWLIIPAALFAIIWMIMVLVLIPTARVGDHIYTLTYENINNFYYYGSIDRVIFFMAVGFVKLSIICFNWRLTGISSDRWKIVHTIFFVLVVVFMIINLLGSVWNCSIAGASFSLARIGRNVGHIKCWNVSLFAEGLRSMHVVFDFFLLTVPIIIIVKMKMPIRKKIQLCALFAVGAVSCISAVMSTILLNQLLSDIPYHFDKQMTWTIVDLVFALTVASLPALNGLFEKTLRRRKSRMATESSSKTSVLGTSNSLTNLGTEEEEKADHNIYRRDDIELAVRSTSSISSGKVEDKQSRPWANVTSGAPRYSVKTTATATAPAPAPSKAKEKGNEITPA